MALPRPDTSHHSRFSRYSPLVGFGATTLWTPLLGFLGANATGTSDPVFGKDISFYLLVLPWYDAVVSIVTTVLVITSRFGR